MLNVVWLLLILFAVLVGGLRGEIGPVSEAAVAGAELGVKLAAGLIGVMTLWLGLMRLADKAGLVRQLGLAMRPVMVWLFPEVPPAHPAMGSILMNMAANILGLNNAATPLGLRAMKELETLNQRPGTATNAMCMLLAINTSSITLIPVTMIALLSQAKAANPTQVIGTTLIASIITHAAAIAAAKFFERSRWYRLPPLEPVAAGAAPSPETKAVSSAKQDEAAAPSWDQPGEELPWVPHAGRILAVVWGLFLAILFITAFPQMMHYLPPDAPPPPEKFWLMSLVDALSILAIPLLVCMFPLYAAMRRVPVYDEFVEGAKEGVQVGIRILPFVVGMMVAIGMFRASGGMVILTNLLRPIATILFFPPELIPMAVVRPFTSVGALGLFSDILKEYGPNHFLTLAGATIYGSSETTFYVLAVYFGSVGVRRTRHALPSGLIADAVGPIASVIICRALMG